MTFETDESVLFIEVSSIQRCPDRERGSTCTCCFKGHLYNCCVRVRGCQMKDGKNIFPTRPEGERGNTHLQPRSHLIFFLPPSFPAFPLSPSLPPSLSFSPDIRSFSTNHLVHTSYNHISNSHCPVITSP